MWSCECVNDTWEAVRRGSDARQAGHDASSLELIRIQLQPGVWFGDHIPQLEQKRDKALHHYNTMERAFWWKRYNKVLDLVKDFHQQVNILICPIL